MFSASDRGRWVGGWALLIVVVAALGLLGFRPDRELPEPVEAARGELVKSVAVEGELAAVRSAEIGVPAIRWWNFKIVWMAPEGSVVAAGDPVVRFDAQELQRQLDQMRGELAEAEGKLAQKEVDLRIQVLDVDKRLAEAEAELGKAEAKADAPEIVRSRLDVEKARLERDGWRQELANVRAERAGLLARADAERRTLVAQRDRARNRVRSLEESIERLSVRSPQEGLVLHQVSRWQQEKKKVGDQVWRGEVVISIPDLSEMRAVGTVDEADGGRLAVGQPVALRLEARPDLELAGTVRSIAPTVRRKSSQVPAKVFEVDIELERNLPELMRPAMRFRGEVVVERLADRLLVPRDAVFLRASGPVVFRRRFWSWVETPVVVGASDARATEVREGLDEGDLVLPEDLAAAESRRSASNARGGEAR